jgi:hypothetical protein
MKRVYFTVRTESLNIIQVNLKALKDEYGQLHNYNLHPHAALTRKSNGRSLKPSKSNALSEILEHWIEKCFRFLALLV